MKRLIVSALRRLLLDAAHRRRVRRVVADLDGCDFCGEPGDVFLDVTPEALSIMARLACWSCAHEVLRTGKARVLMGADGRPVVNYGG